MVSTFVVAVVSCRSRCIVVVGGGSVACVSDRLAITTVITAAVVVVVPLLLLSLSFLFKVENRLSDNHHFGFENVCRNIALRLTRRLDGRQDYLQKCLGQDLFRHMVHLVVAS